jgi:NADH-quinone oxidoreductase subunit C
MTVSFDELALAFTRLSEEHPLPPRPDGEAPAAAPVQAVDYAARGFHLDVQVGPAAVVPAAALLDRHGFALDTITGVDWMAAGEMEVVYDYYHPEAPLRVAVRTRVPRSDPEVPTIAPVYPGANWHERETHDFFGIRFAGHPDLTPFLLPEDADFHPLRKDYAA